MLRAFLADVAQIADCACVTLWDERLGPLRLPRVDFVPIADRDLERTMFHRLAGECDASFVIAPEFDGILARRRRWVDEAGGRFVGCTADAIELCADKLRLARSLSERGIRTPKTVALDVQRRNPDPPFPIVVKPRDGAGSAHTFLVHDADELRRLPLPESGWPSEFVCQPFVAGTAISTAAIIADRGRVRVFPIGAQRLSDDGRFRYLGGEIPAGWSGTGGAIVDEPQLHQAAEDLARTIVEIIPGLAGYVGFDLVVPAAPPREPVLIEINPRLTTAYVGYRRLAEENLAERVLFPDRAAGEIRWRGGCVSFEPDGTTQYDES